MVVESLGTADCVLILAGFLRDRLSAAGLSLQARSLDGLSTKQGAGRVPAAGPTVLAHLHDAIEQARQALPDRVGQALAGSALNAEWTQTEAYLAEPPSQDFLDRYAHATLAGPPDLASRMRGRQRSSERPVECRTPVAFGLLLLAAGVRYPHHQHPADEVYVPLTEARWSHGQYEPFVYQPAGAVLHHRPGQAHAMITDGTPLLALYVWTGAVTVPASWC